MKKKVVSCLKSAKQTKRETPQEAINIQQLDTQSPSPFIQQKTPTTVEHVKPITVPGIDILLRASLFTVMACHRLGKGLMQKTNPIMRAAFAITSYIYSKSIIFS